MKIALLSYSDNQGGAAIAAYRLFKSLSKNKKLKVDLIVYKKNTKESTHLPFKIRLELWFLEKIESLFKRFYLKKNIHTSIVLYRTKSLKNFFKKKKYDIVNFHWTGAFLFNYYKSSSYKIFWTLHDMNPFTGGCHYSDGCDGHTTDCSNCPLLKKSKSQSLFIKHTFRRKINFSRLNINFICLSRWIKNELCRGKLYDESLHKSFNLPNTIDINYFKPKNIKKKYDVLFISSNLKDKRKGGIFVKHLIKRNPELNFLIVGSNYEQYDHNRENVYYVGEVKSEKKLIEYYNKSKILIIPSVEENLSNVILESLACGTPIVGFNIGGNKDFIKYGYLGELSYKINVESLEKAMLKLLSKNMEQTKIHKYIKDNYSYTIVAKKYEELFRAI